MENQSVIERVKELITPLLKGKGVDLVDMAYKQVSRRMILRVIVDKTDGITLDECAHINQELGSLLDKEDIIATAYVLEVSSPGLDRPLVTREDFQRAIDKKVEIFLKNPVDNKSYYAGRLQAVNETSIALEAKTGIIDIPLDVINRGKLIVEFSKR